MRSGEAFIVLCGGTSGAGEAVRPRRTRHGESSRSIPSLLVTNRMTSTRGLCSGRAMSMEIALIVILAAALNPGWNALIKVSGDKIASMATVTFMGAVVSAIVLPFVDLPESR